MTVDGMERLQAIMTMVDTDGRVRVGDLAARFGVSEMTIRRDLDLLAEEGAVRRVRGGATAAGPRPFAERFGRQARAKDRIVAKLVDLVGDGGAVGIDASSTLQRMAAALPAVRDLTVLTNGPDLFLALQSRSGVTPLLTGGQLDRRTGSLVGPLAVRATRDLLLRRLFVSAVGLDPVVGTTEPTLEEAEVKLALADVAAQVVVAIDHSKLTLHGPARCLDIDRIDILVTDLDPSDPRLDPYRDRVTIV